MTTLPRTLAHLLVILTLVIAAPELAFAKGTKKASTPVPHHTTISAISATSITVNEPKGLRTLTITQFTSFTYKGSPVRFDALKPGMRVAIGTGTDPNVAGRIDADDPPSDKSK